MGKDLVHISKLVAKGTTKRAKAERRDLALGATRTTAMKSKGRFHVL
jgi:hypothetical protein